jgi:DNA (cytosine-5)-methyltransferase 1
MSGHPAPSREAGAVIANALANGSGKKGGPDDNAAQGHHVVTATLDSGNARRPSGLKNEADVTVAHTLRAEGHDASEDGTGRGVPLVAQTLTADMYRSGGATAGNNPGTRNVIPYRKAQKAHDPDDCERWEEAEHANTLAGHSTTSSEIALATVPRRLTPCECERLQGFPDDWTEWGAPLSRLEPPKAIPIKDSPRYRMLGNAVTVSVAEWIGSRLALEPHP